MADTSGSLGFDPFEQRLITGGEFLKQDRIAEACAEFQAALAVRPDDARALGLLGLAFFRCSDFASALPVYRKLVEAHPRDASYRLNLGLVHLKLGDAEAAIDELQRSRELDPSQLRAVTYLGLAHARRGDYARAFAAFLQAGQPDLADEMAEYLSEEEQAAVRAAAGVPAASDAGDGAAQPPPVPGAQGNGAQPPPVPGAQGSGAQPPPVPGAQGSGAQPPPVPGAQGGGAQPPPVPGARGGSAQPPPVPGARGGSAQPPPVPGAQSGSADGHSGGAEPPPPRPDEDNDEDAAAHMFDGAAASADAGEPGSEGDGVVQAAADDAGAITRAVAHAEPSSAVTAAAVAPTAEGHTPPEPLTAFATARLIRPQDGQHPFEIGAGGVLIVRVGSRVLSRTEGVIVSGGELAYEIATRRVRGAPTSEPLGGDDRPVFLVSGHGHMVASPLGEYFSAVRLDDDILYVREDLLFAFEERLRWENGHIPGSDAGMHVVQFRGQGCVAMRTRRPPLSVKLMPERVIYADADVLAGWIGRVVPRLVAPVAGGHSSTPFVECTGEGVILIEDLRQD